MSTPPPAGLRPRVPNSEAHHVAVTRWSVVSRAAQDQNVPERAVARDEICQGYWYPMYVFLRRKGYEAHVAEDLVQGFFLHLFEQNLLSKADPKRGRFRTFLLTALTRFASHQDRQAAAFKRGGQHVISSLDCRDAESRYHQSVAVTLPPEAAFDRAWALTILQRALELLRQDYEGNATFEALRSYLTADADCLPYAEMAARLNTTALNVKVSVHRLRTKYRRLLDEQLAATLGEDVDLEHERVSLLNAITYRHNG